MLNSFHFGALCLKAFITISLFLNYAYATDTTETENTSFPADLMIGCASAAYQNEGAWNESGKMQSIWDYYSHKDPTPITTGETADVACDSYHKYQEDVDILKDIGFNHYRFSISWVRVCKSAYCNGTNAEGVQYYHNLIDALLAKGITPLVTIYHWDLPQKLQELGGWTNPNIIQFYVAYAKTLFELYGDKVKWWITLNEPLQIADGFISTSKFAPGVSQMGVADYMATKVLLTAHADVYHLYDKTYRPTQQGKIGIVLDGEWYEPKTNSTADKEAAEREMQFQWGIFANPIFSPDGDFPEIVKRQVDNLSKSDNWTCSRLPTLSQEEIEHIKGTADFFGLNHYGSRLAASGEGEGDAKVVTSYDSSWPNSTAPIFKSVPWGFRKILQKIMKDYNNPEVFVTENGWSSNSGIKDYDRIKFYHSYLKNMLAAIHKDGCNVIGYTIWSCMDNFSWTNGYSRRFGIVQVDMTDENRNRTKKKSADFFSKILTTRVLPKLSECLETTE